MALRAVTEHPKFTRLKASLKLNKATTLGYLECVWHFCGKFTPRGDIGRYEDGDIEAWCEWDGEPGALIKALVETGWLDAPDASQCAHTARTPCAYCAGRLIVHDWHEYADRNIKAQLGRREEGFVTQCAHSVRTACAHRDTDETRQEQSASPGYGPEYGAGAGHGAGGARANAITSCERHEHQPDVDQAWGELPDRVKRNRVKFRDAWVLARQSGVPPGTLADALRRYYASPEGQSRWARQPHNFLEAEGWCEPPEAWETREQTESENRERKRQAQLKRVFGG